MRVIDTTYTQKDTIYSALHRYGNIDISAYTQKDTIYSTLHRYGNIDISSVITNIINVQLNELPPYSDFILLETGHYILTEHDRTTRGLNSLRPLELQYNTRDDVP